MWCNSSSRLIFPAVLVTGLMEAGGGAAPSAWCNGNGRFTNTYRVFPKPHRISLLLFLFTDIFQAFRQVRQALSYF